MHAESISALEPCSQAKPRNWLLDLQDDYNHQLGRGGTAELVIAFSIAELSRKRDAGGKGGERLLEHCQTVRLSGDLKPSNSPDSLPISANALCALCALCSMRSLLYALSALCALCAVCLWHMLRRHRDGLGVGFGKPIEEAAICASIAASARLSITVKFPACPADVRGIFEASCRERWPRRDLHGSNTHTACDLLASWQALQPLHRALRLSLGLSLLGGHFVLQAYTCSHCRLHEENVLMNLYATMQQLCHTPSFARFDTATAALGD